ncbi:MAG: hypothetical protein HKN85_00950, partial [Gammaproteobacteria bacterium]|nr:hypothetical protein [Gammaproteobacteria bacterium]
MKQFLRIAISIGISLGILALLFNMVNSGVPDHQRPSVLEALQNTSKGMLLT